MEKKIAQVLKSLHIAPHLVGYEYLKAAIALVMTDGSYLRGITKELYPAVARAFDATPARVERAIRHAIASGLADAPYDRVVEVIGTYPSATGHITNSHYIAAVAEYIRLGDGNV